jgi:hypothetical protein
MAEPATTEPFRFTGVDVHDVYSENGTDLTLLRGQSRRSVTDRVERVRRASLSVRRMMAANPDEVVLITAKRAAGRNKDRTQLLELEDRKKLRESPPPQE